ncbi:MAG: adenosylmethionine--8-amino-7-oxononanoate transaminase [Chromatiales bacterium]|nr:adenosylmethionine--8-amino-7-oxononanoate transaminase [Chromatiales bacterium]
MTERSTLVSKDRRHVWHPFTQEKTAPDPIPIARGEGPWLYGTDGRAYLDLISSWWVNLHGHAHPAIANAIAEQATKLEQVIFAGFTHEPAVRLAERLAGHLPGNLNRVFYSDDGSTAVEVALKLSIQYWRNREIPRHRILAFEGGYHGDTVGAMSAGRGSGFFEAFSPLLFPVQRLPFPHTWHDDPDVRAKEDKALVALDKEIAQHGSQIAAMIVEPLVQGAAGMRMCRPEFLQAVAERLHAAEILLIFDEVMTGFGRTGDWFACRKAGITPDLICLSKGLTGGFLPLSVTVADDRIFDGFLADDFDHAFIHGHSFTANALGCAAALASMDLLEQDDTWQRISAIQSTHREGLSLLTGHPRVERTRQTGTIAALDVSGGGRGYDATIGPKLKSECLKRGLLLRPLGNVLYLLPPYCLAADELRNAYDTIYELLTGI